MSFNKTEVCWLQQDQDHFRLLNMLCIYIRFFIGVPVLWDNRVGQMALQKGLTVSLTRSCMEWICMKCPTDFLWNRPNRHSRVSESPMPEWEEPTSFLENSGRAWEKNMTRPTLSSLLDRLEKRQQLQLLSSYFPPGLLCLMPSLAVLLQSLASMGPRGGVTKQVAAILGVGSGKQDKSKGGYSDLNVKDSILWWWLVLHLFTLSISLIFVACLFIYFPVWAWGERNPKNNQNKKSFKQNLIFATGKRSQSLRLCDVSPTTFSFKWF